MTASRTDTLRTDLRALADLAHAQGMQSLHREIVEERLPLLDEGRLSMVVLGEFNHGKSSVINALLGRPLLPTGITPTTSVITHIVHGTGPAMMVTERGNIEVPRERLREVIVRQAEEGLRHVDIPVDHPLLAEGVYVVDTPGVNDISRQKVEITYGYVPKADVILYVLDATQAMKRSELTFIRERLLRDTHERLFFLLGKCDALDASELAEVEAHVRGQLRELVGDRPLYLVSARRAMEGQDPGFDAFRSDLVAWLRSQRSRIIDHGAARAGARIAALLDQSLAIESSALELADSELQERLEAVRRRLAQSRTLVSEQLALIDRRCGELRAAARDDLHEFVEAFCRSLPGEISKSAVPDIRAYLADFIHHEFQGFLESEGDHVALQLEALAEEIIAITNRNMRETFQGVQERLGTRGLHLQLDARSFGYDVGVIALGALGAGFLAVKNLLTGGLLTLAAPILAIVLKPKIDQQVRDTATEQALAAVREAGLKVGQEIERSIDTFQSELSRFVEDAGDRLYRQIEEALSRVQTTLTTQGADRRAIAATLATARTDAQRFRDGFAALLTPEHGATGEG